MLFSSVDQIFIVKMYVRVHACVCYLVNVCGRRGVLMAVSCGRMADRGVRGQCLRGSQ